MNCIGLQDVMERTCVGALIVQRNEGLQVLLGRRSSTRAFFPNVWDLPGGHCEPGETLERALFRELHEEIGVVPTTWRLLGELEIPLKDHSESMSMHVYEVTAWLGTPHNRQLGEHSEVAWFTIDEACCLALAHPAYTVLFRSLPSR